MKPYPFHQNAPPLVKERATLEALPLPSIIDPTPIIIDPTPKIKRKIRVVKSNWRKVIWAHECDKNDHMLYYFPEKIAYVTKDRYNRSIPVVKGGPIYKNNRIRGVNNGVIGEGGIIDSSHRPKKIKPIKPEKPEEGINDSFPIKIKDSSPIKVKKVKKVMIPINTTEARLKWEYDRKIQKLPTKEVFWIKLPHHIDPYSEGYVSYSSIFVKWKSISSIMHMRSDRPITPLQEAVEEHGFDNFIIETLYECDNIMDAYYKAFLYRPHRDIGYNRYFPKLPRILCNEKEAKDKIPDLFNEKKIH